VQAEALRPKAARLAGLEIELAGREDAAAAAASAVAAAAQRAERAEGGLATARAREAELRQRVRRLRRVSRRESKLRSGALKWRGWALVPELRAALKLRRLRERYCSSLLCFMFKGGHASWRCATHASRRAPRTLAAPCASAAAAAAI